MWDDSSDTRVRASLSACTHVMSRDVGVDLLGMCRVEDLRKFLLEQRKECAHRLLKRIFVQDEDGDEGDLIQSKFWFSFAKRKFMNMSMV